MIVRKIVSLLSKVFSFESSGNKFTKDHKTTCLNNGECLSFITESSWRIDYSQFPTSRIEEKINHSGHFSSILSLLNQKKPTQPTEKQESSANLPNMSCWKKMCFYKGVMIMTFINQFNKCKSLVVKQSDSKWWKQIHISTSPLTVTMV